MKTKKTPLLIACSAFFLSSFFCQAQTSEKLFDKPFFYESELTPEMIYVKWFSIGTKPAWDFLVLRFDEKKVVQVNGNKMSYLQNDTTFYVVQDTVPPVIRPGEMLQYFISPHDSNGKAGESSEIALISGDLAHKAWFTSTQATKIVNDFGVNVSWKLSNIAGVKFINIYRSVFSDKDYTLLSSVSATETSFTDRDTKADVVYFYQLEAVSLTGNKSIKSNVIFSAAFNPQPPVPPYIESVMPVKGGAVLSIQITDEEVAGVRIYRDDGLVPTLILVSDLIPKSDASVIVFYDTLSALSGRRTYTYAAKTESTSFVESDFSNKVYVRPVISSSPDIPKTFEAFEEDGKVKLFWEDVEARDIGIAGYLISRVEEGKNNEFASLLPENLLLDVNNFTDSTALSGKVYSYMVQTVDIDGNVSLSGAVATVSLQTDIPVPPFALYAFSIENGIRLEWSQSIYEGLESVNLYRYQSGSSARLLVKLPSDAFDYLDETVLVGNQYYYYLTSTNKAGTESEPSETAAAKR